MASLEARKDQRSSAMRNEDVAAWQLADASLPAALHRDVSSEANGARGEGGHVGDGATDPGRLEDERPCSSRRGRGRSPCGTRAGEVESFRGEEGVREDQNRGRGNGEPWALRDSGASTGTRLELERDRQPAQVPLSLLIMMEWTGRSGYFALGNSNSIATINVSKAFTGLADYDYTLCGIFTALITFSGPLVLWYSTISALNSLVRRREQSQNRQQREHVWLSGTLLTAASIHTSMRIVCLASSCAVAVIFRNHLFVWSVFSPKLLYELVFSVTMLAAHAVSLLAAAAADLASLSVIQ